jgi:hypothetical protein
MIFMLPKDVVRVTNQDEDLYKYAKGIKQSSAIAVHRCRVTVDDVNNLKGRERVNQSPIADAVVVVLSIV